MAGFRVPEDRNPDVPSEANPAPRERQFSRLRSFGYLMYYGVDYLLGNPIMFYARGKGEFILFDRYYYDYLIQPGMSLPPWMIGMLMHLIPSPDIVVHLKNSPDVVLSRKPELSREEIVRQNAACAQLILRLRQGYVVETTGTPDETVQQLAKVMVNHLSKLYKASAFISEKDARPSGVAKAHE
jgi:hypothetical protein